MSQTTIEPSETAKSLLIANVVVLCLLVPLHLAGIGSVAVNLTVFFAKHTTRPLLEDPQRIGNLIAYAMCGAWAVGGLALAPLAAVGLGLRTRWGRTVAQLYWGLSLVSVCCLPVGAIGLWSLSRDDVKRALGAQ